MLSKTVRGYTTYLDVLRGGIWRQQVPPKRWHNYRKIYGATSQKIVIFSGCSIFHIHARNITYNSWVSEDD